MTEQPHRLGSPAVTPGVFGVIVTPKTPGPHAAVILLPGLSGWNAFYAARATSLAESGFVALALDYCAETGPASVESQQWLRTWGRWQETVRNAATYLRALPAVSQNAIGLIGYSLGAFLAVSVASSTPGVNAVVDFFGGGGAAHDSLEEEVRLFPPLLILHGEADTVVPVAHAHRLHDAVTAQGRTVEMHLYPGAEHAFSAPWSPNYSEACASDAYARMTDFLGRHLARTIRA